MQLDSPSTVPKGSQTWCEGKESNNASIHLAVEAQWAAGVDHERPHTLAKAQYIEEDTGCD